MWMLRTQKLGSSYNEHDKNATQEELADLDSQFYSEYPSRSPSVKNTGDYGLVHSKTLISTAGLALKETMESSAFLTAL